MDDAAGADPLCLCPACQSVLKPPRQTQLGSEADWYGLGRGSPLSWTQRRANSAVCEHQLEYPIWLQARLTLTEFFVADGTRLAGNAVSPSPATSTPVGIPVGHDDTSRTGSDQAARPVGTGVFMPMIGRSSSRSKPQRRRNASTSCLSDPGRSRQPQRNNSSTNLLDRRAGCSSGAVLIPGSVSSMYPGMGQPAHQPSFQGMCTKREKCGNRGKRQADDDTP